MLRSGLSGTHSADHCRRGVLCTLRMVRETPRRVTVAAGNGPPGVAVVSLLCRGVFTFALHCSPPPQLERCQYFAGLRDSLDLLGAEGGEIQGEH